MVAALGLHSWALHFFMFKSILGHLVPSILLWWQTWDANEAFFPTGPL